MILSVMSGNGPYLLSLLFLQHCTVFVQVLRALIYVALYPELNSLRRGCNECLGFSMSDILKGMRQ
jgi:hypothetical protein